VRDFVKSENSAMRRQAQIQFDVYSVTVDESDEHGIDWTAALASLKHPALRIAGGAPATLAGATAGNVAISILGGQGGDLSNALGNSRMIVQALSANGYSAQHRPVSLLALNRQWARVSRLGTEYYLSETTPGPASSTGVGAPGLKTDKVTTGDRYVAMPQILDDNTIMLKFDMSLSDLLGLFDVTVGTGATAQKIQAPKLTAVSAQMPVALRPGEVVAITGLSRVVVSNDSRRLSEGAPIGLGGSQKMSTKREHFLIFIRPVIL
jgi:type II secretory pathway component GspD/PulD (secretin)